MAGKARILVADDEPHIRRIIQFLLEQEGFEVLQANDGHEAWEIAQSGKPDLALLDVMMPQMDGFTVLEKIREGFETSRLPVILLTAKAEDNDKVRGLRSGANDYIVKPFNHDELLLRVTNLLAVTQQDREANPLTGLPGNRAIEREVFNRIDSGTGFGLMYVDVDRFKSFNDHYGYARGDKAISFTAQVLKNCSIRHGSGKDFIGHVGGDDFVLVTSLEHAENLACRIVEEFDAGKIALHDPEDAKKGYLTVKSRTEGVVAHPLITLTIALICEDQQRYEHPAQLSDTMAELKSFGKSQANSVVVRDRRGTDELPELINVGSDSETNTL